MSCCHQIERHGHGVLCAARSNASLVPVSGCALHVDGPPTKPPADSISKLSCQHFVSCKAIVLQAQFRERSAVMTAGSLLQDLIEGKPLTRDFPPRLVDVRDVARAHILAVELPQAHGRYILANSHKYEFGELWEALSQSFPEATYPSKEYKRVPVIDNTKVRSGPHPCPK